MKLKITAKPKAKKEYIKRLGIAEYVVAVHAPPVGGKANAAIIKSLATYFHVPPSSISIVVGETAKKKVIEIPLTSHQMEKIEEDRVLQKKLL